MSAQSTLTLPGIEGNDVTAERYLRAILAVAPLVRRGEYIVVHVTSGLFLRTDWLGAFAVEQLISGRSDADVIDAVERAEAGAREQALRLVFILRLKGALVQGVPTPARRWARRTASYTAGLAVQLLVRTISVVPVGLLARAYRLILSVPIGRDRARTPAGKTIRPKRSFNYLFMYLSVNLTGERLVRLVENLFDTTSCDDAALELNAEGPAVAVFLHGPVFPAVPNALRNRGHEMVRVVAPLTHGMNLSPRSGPIAHFFGDPPEQVVEENPNPIVSGGALLRHLKEGHSVYVALDNIGFVRDPVTGKLGPPEAAAEVTMLGHSFPRNDGPAWLAIRSRRPIVLLTTHCSPTGKVVLSTSPALYADQQLPLERRIAELSYRLYACAERAILERPESWRYWSYLDLMTVKRSTA